jgi:RHS repeat-associated protein
MVTMRYDADGRRVELVTRPNGQSATTTTFRYQGSSIAQEYVGTSPVLSRTYVTDEAGSIVKFCDPDCSGSNPQYLVTWNGHGDAMAIWRINADGSLTLANSFTYTTWGTPTTTTHNGIADKGFRFLYVGRYGVASDNALGLGLHHMGVRHYSPALGRFLQPDPSAAEANLYAYAAANPITGVDPTGLFWYRTKRGDTLLSLSRKFWGDDNHIGQLINENRARLPKRRITLHPGQCLWIPRAVRWVGDSSCVPRKPPGLKLRPADFRPCDPYKFGLGLGIMILGSFEVAGGCVTIVASGGVLTLPAAVAILAGTEGVVAGASLVYYSYNCPGRL